MEKTTIAIELNFPVPTVLSYFDKVLKDTEASLGKDNPTYRAMHDVGEMLKVAASVMKPAAKPSSNKS